MLKYLIRLFVQDHQNVSDPGVRRAYGTLLSGMGIVLNILLSALKVIAGLFSGSVAVVADGINNLSDAASSVITLIGFRLSGKADDEEHPFGHGRMEYISGLIVSIVILFMGLTLARSSLTRIFRPEPVDFDTLTACILIFSVLVKLYMYICAGRTASLIDSPSIKAAAADAMSDTIATLAVLASGTVHHFTGANTDGWTGLIVSVLILRAGYCAARETISPLLGNRPNPEFVRQVEEIVLGHEQISGIHDLIVHDYGPGRTLISLHAEVACDGDLIALHDAIDAVERRLKSRLNCEAVIHMDPVQTSDEAVIRIREAIASVLAERIDPRISIHDFRISSGSTGTNVIFDAVIPHELDAADSDIKSAICQIIVQMDEHFIPTVTLEHAYSPENRL